MPISTQSAIQAVRTKHANAVWEIEQLWEKVPKDDYKTRKRLVTSAVHLAQLGLKINDMSRKYKT